MVGFRKRTVHDYNDEVPAAAQQRVSLKGKAKKDPSPARGSNPFGMKPEAKRRKLRSQFEVLNNVQDMLKKVSIAGGGGSVPPQSKGEQTSEVQTPTNQDPPHSVLGPGLTIYSFHRKGGDRFARDGERKETLSYDKDRVFTYNHFMRQTSTANSGPFWRNG